MADVHSKISNAVNLIDYKTVNNYDIVDVQLDIYCVSISLHAVNCACKYVTVTEPANVNFTAAEPSMDFVIIWLTKQKFKKDCNLQSCTSCLWTSHHITLLYWKSWQECQHQKTLNYVINKAVRAIKCCSWHHSQVTRISNNEWHTQMIHQVGLHASAFFATADQGNCLSTCQAAQPMACHQSMLPGWQHTATMLHLFRFCGCELCVLCLWSTPGIKHTQRGLNRLNHNFNNSKAAWEQNDQ